MYLFRDQEEIEIKLMCKLCFKEVKFKISAKEYQKITEFPFRKESVHGLPEHKLIVYINKNLEIDTFKIKELKEPKEEEKKLTKEQQDLTRQLLSNIDLSDEEIELYFRTTGRDVVSLGEIALLISKPKEECQKIADRFVEKGLFKAIPGITPHYAALPPYAALMSQLQKFHNYIVDIKESAPKELNQSFSKLEAQASGVKQLKDYTDFIEDLKDNSLSQLITQQKDFDNIAKAISQISEISSVITNLESDTKNIMDNQMASLSNQFKEISSSISTSMKHQIEDLTGQFENISKDITKVVHNQVKDLQSQFESIKSKISKNMEKLRLGVLKQAVDQVVEMSFADWIKNITERLNLQLSSIDKASKDGMVKTKIALNRQIGEIERLHSEGLENTTVMFNNLISNLREAIDKTVNNISGITNSTAKSGEDVKLIFDNISKKFGEAVTLAEKKLGGITENVFNSFDGLKEVFSSKIIATLNDLLANIIDKLEASEKATTEFWDQAKKSTGAALTFKDIWFVRSIEGAKAHINDQLSKSKMRVLIIAPQITDINIDAIKACKPHINIRIAALIDISNSKHQEMVEELSKMKNVSVRNRRLQNLWGINKDYEEVVVCVVSTSTYGIEVAGIGSIIQEHIKIFVPILEDAWMGASKDVIPGLRASFPEEPVQKPIVSPNSTKQIEETPKITPPPQPPLGIKQTVSKPSLKTIQKPIESEIKPVTIPEQVLIKSEPEIKKSKITAEPELAKKSVPEKSQIEPAIQPTPKVIKKAESSKASPLKEEFDTLLANIGKSTGQEIATILERIKNIITETRGYSGILQPLILTLSSLQSNPSLLSQTEISQLLNKVEFWRRKLNI
jgi:hypothetical protein